MSQAAKQQEVKPLPRNMSGFRVAVKGPRYQPTINNGVDSFLSPPSKGAAHGLIWALLMVIPFWVVVISYLF